MNTQPAIDIALLVLEIAAAAAVLGALVWYLWFPQDLRDNLRTIAEGRDDPARETLGTYIARLFSK